MSASILSEICNSFGAKQNLGHLNRIVSEGHHLSLHPNEHHIPACFGRQSFLPKRANKAQMSFARV